MPPSSANRTASARTLPSTSACCASSNSPIMPPMDLANCVAIQLSARVVISRNASPSRPETAFTGINAGCISVRPLVSAPSISPCQKMAGLPSPSAASENSLSSAMLTSFAFCLKYAVKCRSAAANKSLRSLALAAGSTRNAKPRKVPMSSPSTRTCVSALISTGNNPTSVAFFRSSIDVRLSTNRWRNASCNASDNFSSNARARSAMAGGLVNQSLRWAI